MYGISSTYKNYIFQKLGWWPVRSVPGPLDIHLNNYHTFTFLDATSYTTASVQMHHHANHNILRHPTQLDYL